MRHRKRTVKLGRTSKHCESMLSNMVCSLIQHHRIQTTLAKAKALKPLAEKMVTLGKKGTLHHRRLAIARIKQEDAVHKLFSKIAPHFKDRQGGYTRIYKLGFRQTDAAPIALVEWVDFDASTASASGDTDGSKTALKQKLKADQASKASA